MYKHGVEKAVEFEFRGVRDVIWCPYANEPTFLKYVNNEPDCDMCNKNYEEETHPYICTIRKPY